MPRRALAALALAALACAGARPAPKESSQALPPTPSDAPPSPDTVHPSLPLLPPLPPPSAFASVPPSGPDRWWNGAVFYEVNVRSFADSDGDGIGDLAGLTARLDYFRGGDPDAPGSLGVDALWLLPIFASPSEHGYDVVDYLRVDPRYGTLEDLRALLLAAHRRGLRVVLDLPLNHTSDRHPWFQDSVKGPRARHRNFYEWSPTNPGWGQPWSLSTPAWHRRGGAFYYGLFQGGMPDLNYRNPEVRAEMAEVMRFWLEFGVDGFRLDAARYLVETGPVRGQASTPETHALLKEFSARVHALRPDAVLLGEVWSITEDIADYYGDGTDELELNFDFPLAAALVRAAKGGKVEELASVLLAVKRSYPPGAVDALFLTNHDQPRIATQLQGDPSRLRFAAALLFTLPGSPFLYQGEELGQENGPGEEDAEKRTPFAWDCAPPGHGFTTVRPWHAFAPGSEVHCAVAEEADRSSLLSFYRRLLGLRKASPALSRGDLKLLKVPGAARSAIAFLRRAGDEAVLVVHNAGTDSADTGILDVEGTLAEPLLEEGARLVREEGGWRATLPPLATGIWRMR